MGWQWWHHGFGTGGVCGGAAGVREGLTSADGGSGSPDSAWHSRMLAAPGWMVTVGLLPMRFVPMGLLVLLLLLFPMCFFSGAAGGSRVHAGGAACGTSAGRVHVVALALPGAPVASGVLVCDACGVAAAAVGCLLVVPLRGKMCLSVAW